MKTYDKAIDWVGFVIDLGKANDIYINLYKLYDIMFKANATMEKIGVPLFREEPIYLGKMVNYKSIREQYYGFAACPITMYEPCKYEVDLIQVNAIRKAMGLPVVHADLEEGE